MICPNCGNTIYDGAAECPFCGAVTGKVVNYTDGNDGFEKADKPEKIYKDLGKAGFILSLIPYPFKITKVLALIFCALAVKNLRKSSKLSVAGLVISAIQVFIWLAVVLFILIKVIIFFVSFVLPILTSPDPLSTVMDMVGGLLG